MAKFLLKTRELIDKTLSLSTGQNHSIVVVRPQLFVLDVEDSHFHLNRSVVLPDLATTDGSTPVLDERRITGLGVMYAALVHAKAHAAQGVLVTGHTDASGAGSYNQKLSEDRAKNVSFLLRGLRDDWRALAAGDDNVDDVQALLTWQAERAGWDCDPGGIDNKPGTKTEKAIHRFQELYNQEVDRQTGKDTPFRKKIGVDGTAGKETWGAFYDLYMTELIDLLELGGYAELEARQAALKVPPGMKEFVGCGEHIPFTPARRNPFEKGTDEHLEGPQKNPPDRRVEILFFDPGEEVPQVCHPEPGKCIPAECPIYVKAPFRQNPIGIPKGLPIAEVDLLLTFEDPEGKVRPFPEGLAVEAKFGDPANPPLLLDDDDPDANDAPDPGQGTPPDVEGADPDAESMEMDQEPDAITQAGGLLHLEIPRQASKLYLRLFPGKDKPYVTGDPKKLDDQKLASRDDAIKEVGAGRVFFMLPEVFNTRDGNFELPSPPAGVTFKDGAFLDVDNRDTQIGTPDSPVELRLKVTWQFFQFAYFDRWTSSMTSVPQPRSKDAGGADVPPLVLEGTVFLPQAKASPRPQVESVWDLKSGKDTIHCLGWPRGLVSDDEKRVLPDDTCATRFRSTDLFVRTEGDGKSADADRKFVTVPPDDDLLAHVTADRLRLYDLPRDWRTTNYPVRISGEGIDKNRLFKDAVGTQSTLAKPYLVSLDTIVLEDDDQKPDVTAAFDDSKIENRFAIFDNQMKVWKPDPAGGEPYFTKLDSLLKKPALGVLHDFPPFTRLIARGTILYDVFERRTPANSDFQSAPVGARLASRIGSAVSNTNVTLSANPFQAMRPNGSNAPLPSLGVSIGLVLRCCGHDGAVELFNVVHYVSVNFDFAPTAPFPPGAVPLAAAPADAVNRVRDCLIKVANRWNGNDGVHKTPPLFEVDDPIKARGSYTAVLLRGNRGAQATPDPGEIRIKVFKKLRAFMQGNQGSWELDDLAPSGDAFVAAHEFGHVFSQPDEYLNTDDEPSMQQPNTGEVGRSPGAPYGLDPTAMMNENLEPRARYFWDPVLFAHANGFFTDAKTITVVHGPLRFTSALTDPDQSRVRTAVAPFGTNASVGPLGLCDRFLYVTGHDEFTAGKLRGSSAANPYDGMIVVRVKMAWTVTTTSDFDELRTIFGRARAIIHEAFNASRQVVARGLFDGSAVRLRVLFAPRFVCRTFPTGAGASKYLTTDLNPPAANAAVYTQVVGNVVARDGVHAEINMADSGTAGVTSGMPRQALVRKDGTTAIFFSDDAFEDSVLRVFSQLVGLKDETAITANNFRPLVTGLPKLTVASLEIIS